MSGSTRGGRVVLFQHRSLAYSTVFAGGLSDSECRQLTAYADEFFLEVNDEGNY